jgi:hypothetical protein
MQPEKQTYRLRIVSDDGAVQGPELSFEEAANILVTLMEEGFESVEGWTPDRPMTDDETHALIDRANEIYKEKQCTSD